MFFSSGVLSEELYGRQQILEAFAPPGWFRAPLKSQT